MILTGSLPIIKIYVRETFLTNFKTGEAEKIKAGYFPLLACFQPGYKRKDKK